jgi:hypothetical protein
MFWSNDLILRCAVDMDASKLPAASGPLSVSKGFGLRRPDSRWIQIPRRRTPLALAGRLRLLEDGMQEAL